MKQYTIKEYAAKLGVRGPVAKRKLEKMVQEGKAIRLVGYDQVVLPPASLGMKQPPPYRVNLYRII